MTLPLSLAPQLPMSAGVSAHFDLEPCPCEERKDCMTRSAVSRIPVILLAASIYSFWPSAGDAQVMEVLHSFSGCPQTGCAVGSPYDGAEPRSALVFGDGQLYGT